MSVDTNQYLGPYLKIKIPREKITEQQDPKCCGLVQGSGKFCSSCGKLLVSAKVEVERDAISQYDIAQTIDEELHHLHDMAGEGRDGFDYWSPNGAPQTWKLPDHETVGAQEVIAADIERTTALFGKKYKKEIATIEAAYNAKGEVKFGLLVWFS